MNFIVRFIKKLLGIHSPSEENRITRKQAKEAQEAFEKGMEEMKVWMEEHQ